MNHALSFEEEDDFRKEIEYLKQFDLIPTGGDKSEESPSSEDSREGTTSLRVSNKQPRYVCLKNPRLSSTPESLLKERIYDIIQRRRKIDHATTDPERHQQKMELLKEEMDHFKEMCEEIRERLDSPYEQSLNARDLYRETVEFNVAHQMYYEGVQENQEKAMKMLQDCQRTPNLQNAIRSHSSLHSYSSLPELMQRPRDHCGSSLDKQVLHRILSLLDCRPLFRALAEGHLSMKTLQTDKFFLFTTLTSPDNPVHSFIYLRRDLFV